MRFARPALSLAALLLAGAGVAQTAAPEGDIRSVHDPVLIRQGGTWHVFSTGIGKGGQGVLSERTSNDLIHWQAGTAPFDKLPDWATQAIPGARNLWAPDISFVNGRYRLYYSVSTFGSNRSAIGLATSATLDPQAPGYGWRDEGMVLESVPSDAYNAIDPAFIVDKSGRHWLSFGSFWSGLKLVELNPQTGKPLRPKARPLALASRPVPAGAPSIIEAPYIFERGGYYWLIASYDYCCKGVNSTYYTVIGRSKSITGPYLGKDGSSMSAGGGTVLLRADLEEKGRFRGPGHAGHYRGDDGIDHVVYHAYDKENAGAPTLRVATLQWGNDGWPTAK
ncbi:arabinan endo-1,5-alpha-L-arabinosidase [Nostoc sp. 3335mG]|nr:arabinan endo-1,5-alpha-L-arabinosidase [Nostoc sp. 3335mG]